MTQEDKELLIKDLCARLPYKPKVHIEHDVFYDEIDPYDTELNLVVLSNRCTGMEIKPYLRPMSSMTDEEEGRYNLCQAMAHSISEEHWTANDGNVWKYSDAIDYLNEHHFDYRSLIEKGLALEAPKGMYKF